MSKTKSSKLLYLFNSMDLMLLKCANGLLGALEVYIGFKIHNSQGHRF